MAELKQEHRPSSLWEPPHIKEEPEEPELSIKQEPEELPFHIITVKTEDDEEERAEENREEANGEESGHSDEDTDLSDDYGPQESPSKRSYAMIPPDSSVTDHKPFGCSHCGKSFRWSSELQRHKSVHTGERPHKCSVCEKSYKEKGDLNVHLRTHTAERLYTCSVCEKTLKYKSDLLRHLKQIHIICPVCETRFCDKIELDAHLQTHDKRNVENPKPWSCSECGFRFRIHSLLRRHMLVHTRERPFTCSVCGKGFNAKSTLAHHLKQVHLMCPVCEEHFPDKAKLAGHLRTHVEEGVLDQSALRKETKKPRSCSECGKRFKCDTDVKRHMSVHTGERPHACSLCDKTFTQKGSLSTHMRTHTGERPYSCSVCDKRFTKGFNLKKHLRTHAEKETVP